MNNEHMQELIEEYGYDLLRDLASYAEDMDSDDKRALWDAYCEIMNIDGEIHDMDELDDVMSCETVTDIINAINNGDGFDTEDGYFTYVDEELNSSNDVDDLITEEWVAIIPTVTYDDLPTELQEVVKDWQEFFEEEYE